VAQGVIGAEPLPAGRYVARARIMRGEKLAGVLVRPFILEAAPASKGGPILIPAAFARVAAFDRNAVLQPALLNGMLESIAARSPSLKSAMTEARAGRYGPAALEALTAGDQQAAAFLKGLDLYAKGEINPAATQLSIAAGPRREFYPAAFLLGACFAAGGRDREAAGIWQLALGEHAPAGEHATGGRGCARAARGRHRHPETRIRGAPRDDDLGKRLAIGYLMTGAYGDALPILTSPHASRHGSGRALCRRVVALPGGDKRRCGTVDDRSREGREIREGVQGSATSTAREVPVINGR
jgi:hypothetical protein